MVFQNPDNQFVGATVEDDVAFGLENQGIPLEEMKKRVSEALSLVGMAEFSKRNQLACQVAKNREWLSQALSPCDQTFNFG